MITIVPGDIDAEKKNLPKTCDKKFFSMLNCEFLICGFVVQNFCKSFALICIRVKCFQKFPMMIKLLKNKFLW